MEVKPSYKQTEAGIIPAEWEVFPLDKIAKIERGKFTARPRNDPRFYGGKIPFIQTGDVTNSHGRVTSYSQTLNSAGLKVSKLFPRGTLFFTIAANIGDVGFAEFDAACPDSLVAITPKGDTDKNWLAFELARRKKSFEGIASHNAQANINLEKLRPYLVPYPPPAEQRAIAESLSDVDRLLRGMDRLISKKRDIKQAATQQLLTGKIRLAGFDGKWQVAKLGQIIARFSTGLNPRDNFRLNCGGSFFYVTIKNFSEGHLHLNDDCDRIDEAAFRLINERSELRKDDILLASIGRVGDAFLIPETPTNWNINESVFVLRPDKERVVPIMFFYLLTNKSVKDALGQGVTGSTFKSIKQADLKEIPCHLPVSHEEQNAIAEMLSDMDAELHALEQRRRKTRALKRAMMQELLTGQTRIISTNVSNA